MIEIMLTSNEIMTVSGASQSAGIYRAILRPHRSLPPVGYKIIIAVIGVTYGVFAWLFISLSAYAPALILAAAFFSVWLAFEISMRNCRMSETVEIEPDEMRIVRFSPVGGTKRWTFHPFWTRVEFDRPFQHESQVKIISKGEAVMVGGFLSPQERERFAYALKNALQRIKNNN